VGLPSVVFKSWDCTWDLSSLITGSRSPTAVTGLGGSGPGCTGSYAPTLVVGRAVYGSDHSLFSVVFSQEF